MGLGCWLDIGVAVEGFGLTCGASWDGHDNMGWMLVPGMMQTHVSAGVLLLCAFTIRYPCMLVSVLSGAECCPSRLSPIERKP